MDVSAVTPELIKSHARQARAKGRSFTDNPFLRRHMLFHQTGETREAWQEKHDTWRDAWLEEDARQGSTSNVTGPVPGMANKAAAA